MVFVTLALVAGACGSSPSAKEGARPLTSEEASTLADSLYLNSQDGGATFTANAALTVTRVSIAMQGEVDWRNGSGHAVVSTTGTDAGLTEVWWNPSSVIEYWPMIGSLLPGLGYTGVSFVSRGPDPEHRLIDRVIAVVNGLASKERENAVLIQQKPGSEFVRSDELRGITVDVLRYGERNLYWIDASSSRMLRFDGNAASGTAPVIVDLLGTGVRTVELPPPALTIPTDRISALYQSLTGP